MRVSTIHLRLSAWLALVALVWGALVPVATQLVVAGSDRAGWVQICSVSGMTWVQLDAAPDPGGHPADGSDSASNGCTWCTAHVAGGWPPAPWAWGLVPSAPVWHALVPASAWLARDWSPVQGRAPPAVS